MTTAALPAPLVPADVDLRDFGYLPLDVVRLRDSDLSTHATGEAFKAAVLLWCASWHQIPAGSLPRDDKLLRKFAGFPHRWKAVKEQALRGFVHCSDGRLYHVVLCEKALESWTKKLAQRERTRAASAARHRRDPHDGGRNDVRNGERDEVQGKGRDREVKGREDRARAPERGTEPIKRTAPKVRLEGDLRDAAIAEILAAYPANPHNRAHDVLAERAIGYLLDDGIVDAETLKANVVAYAAQQDAMSQTGTQFVMSKKTFFGGGARGPWQGPFEIPEDPDAPRVDESARTWKPGAT
jgi:hypothetical protein